MLEEGTLDREGHRRARETPIEVRPPRPPVSVADYFVEEIRRELDNRYGADALYRSGFTIETGLDLELQRETEAALQRGVREVAKRQGFVPPETNILDEEEGSLEEYTHEAWHLPLTPGRIVTGLVMDAGAKSARIRIAETEFEIGPETVEWAKLKAVDEGLRAGDLAPFLVVEKEDGSLGLELSAEPTANGAAVAIDPATGEIKAMVGGLDFGTSQFNRAVQAHRQPGSSFKPILYSAALEEGWRATDVLLDEPTVFMDPRTDVPYQPENYYKDYRGIVTVRYALEESLNIPTVRLLNLVGYRRVVEQARRMGITSPLQPYPAMALGASEVTLMELVAAYATLANLGTRVEPRLYTRLTSYADGRTEEVLPRASDGLRPEVAYQVTSLLKGVIARGTAKKASGMGENVAGKTGTTDDNTDAWFIGYSPSLALGVWVGRDEKESLGNTETGPRAALPIWMEIMSSYLAGRPPETFRRPPGIETVAVDLATGLRAGIRTGCERVILEEYRRDEGPPPLCGDHAHRRVSLPYYMQRYPWLDERTLVLTDADLSRLIREAGHDMLVDPEQKIIVPAGGRLDVLPFMIVAPDHPILSGLAGSAALVAGSSAALGPARAVSSGMDLLYPPDLSPLNGTVAEPPTLGIDGHTAAVVPIRYP
jgi:penicillin-binding protein 1A